MRASERKIENTAALLGALAALLAALLSAFSENDWIKWPALTFTVSFILCGTGLALKVFVASRWKRVFALMQIPTIVSAGVVAGVHLEMRHNKVQPWCIKPHSNSTVKSPVLVRGNH